MSFIFPFSSLFFGLIFSKNLQTIKNILSKLLAMIFIPTVIIYNIIYFNVDYLKLIVFSFVTSSLLFLISYLYEKNTLKSLCFSYTNIGWLGLPLAISFFGEKASVVMISLYVGGSIFGNIFGSVFLQKQESSLRKTLFKILKSPPLIAIYVALIIKLSSSFSFVSKQLIEEIYFISKIGMTFCGMCILGIWLRDYKFSIHSIYLNIRISLAKLFLGIIFTLFLLFLFLDNMFISDNIYIIFLLFTLPPAANIVALETAYKGTGKSADYVGSGTIVSLIFIFFYYIFIKSFILI